jgi:hypothetical protein
MTILEGLARLSGIPTEKLRAILNAGREAFPDLDPEVAAKLAALDTAIGPDSLATLADILGTELPSVLQGHFSGKPRPSDLV